MRDINEIRENYTKFNDFELNKIEIKSLRPDVIIVLKEECERRGLTEKSKEIELHLNNDSNENFDIEMKQRL